MYIKIITCGKVNSIESDRWDDEFLIYTRKSLQSSRNILIEPFFLPSSSPDPFENVPHPRYNDPYERYKRPNVQDAYLVWDGIHPTIVGHELIAQLWISAVEADKL